MDTDKNIMKMPKIMGILNVTPDSFSDGGDAFAPRNALYAAEKMVQEGADILDIGAESTRPGSVALSAGEEIERLESILPLLAQNISVPLSIDTYKAKTASFALSCGVQIVNDVHGFRYDPDMAKVTKDADAYCILMHQKEQKNEDDDIIEHVKAVLGHSIEIALAANIAKEKIILDIGIGFGKTYQQNLTLLKHQAAFCEFFQLPFLIGASRKSFIGHFLNIESPKERDAATLAVHIDAVQKGHAQIVRAHNVKMHYEAFKILELL